MVSKVKKFGWTKILSTTFLLSTLASAVLITNNTSRNFLFNSGATPYGGECEHSCKVKADDLDRNISCASIEIDIFTKCDNAYELKSISNPYHYTQYQQARKDCDAALDKFYSTYDKCSHTYKLYYSCMTRCEDRGSVNTNYNSSQGSGSKTNYQPGTKFFMKNN